MMSPVAHVEEPDDRKTHGDRGDGGFGGQDRQRFEHADQQVRPGSLLVSATDLMEPSFRRTVVYVIEHNQAGSLGVVINRPSETAIRSVLPQWAPLAAQPSALYVGGPVKRDAAMCIASLRVGARIERVPGLRRVDGRLVLVDLDSDPAMVAPYLDRIRIFAGYSGWTYGQLDGELERHDWMVFSALPGDVVGSAGVDVWAQVLRRQPLPLALRATHPIEIERN